jgi:hypothetical protein
MKGILRDTLQESPESLALCESYANQNGFFNIDFLLDKMIYPDNAFNTLLIIDELEDELASIVRQSLAFPVETLTIGRFRSPEGETVYEFEPFLYDLSIQGATVKSEKGNTPAIDPSEIDTIVVPARKEGFKETFIGENMWRAVRIHSSMLPKIRYVATYQVAPDSAITYIGEVDRIEPWKDTGKYALYFKEPAREITPIRLVPGGEISAPQAPRYTSLKRIQNAKNLDEVF